jgi:sporulation protein YabP
MTKEGIRHTDLNVKERNKITLNGVINVESFEESYVTLATGEARICIEGKGLKIESLSREDGEIQITGKVNGVYYNEPSKAKSHLKRLFG